MSTTYLYMIYLEADIRELDGVKCLLYLYMIYLVAGIRELDGVKCLLLTST